MMKHSTRKRLIALGADGVLLDYSAAYAGAWERTFSERLDRKNSKAYWPIDRQGVRRLAVQERDRLRAVFDDHFQSSISTAEGASRACHMLVDAGHTLLCVAALQDRHRVSRERNLRELRFCWRQWKPGEQCTVATHCIGIFGIRRKDVSAGELVIFLDFDGVLHPEPSIPSEYFRCLPFFEQAIRQAPACEIVIASAWRVNHSLEELIKPFSSDIAARITGVTPALSEVVEIPESLTLFEREAECQAWLRANGRAYLPWVALDDRHWLYRPFSRNVFLIDGSRGMQASDIEPLVQRLVDIG